MRLTLLTIGSRWDVQPMVALSQGLRREGHEVRIATFNSFRPLVEGAGLTLAPLAGTAQEVTESKEGQEMMDSGQNIVKQIRAIRAISRKLIQQEGYWESFQSACKDAQAVIYHYTAPQGLHLAEKLGIPSIVAAIAPSIVPTRAFPHPFWPGEPKLGGAFNGFTHQVCEQFMWQPFRGMINDWRQQHLQLAPAPLRGPYPLMRKSLVLYAFSPNVVPRPADWDDRVRVTGFWFVEPTDWKPSTGLLDFLATGTPPVYLGFGSASTLDEGDGLRIIREALQLSGQRGVVSVHSDRLRSLTTDSCMFPIDEVSHEWLLPRTCAVVHHGGSGSTAAGLKAGVPNVVVPFFADQPFWGRRIAALGVGPQPIPRKELTAKSLADAIQSAVNDQSMRQKAATLGEKIRAERGVEQASAIITRHLQILDEARVSR